MRSILLLLSLPLIASAQVNHLLLQDIRSYGAKEFRSPNGEYSLFTVPSIDTASAYTFLRKKGHASDVWYSFGLYMNGHVVVGNDGQVARFDDVCDSFHYTGSCMKFIKPDSMVLFVADQRYILPRVLSECLEHLPPDPSNRPAGILDGDPILHSMATNPIFIDGDRLFVCTQPKMLHVFDLNSGGLIETSDGTAYFSSRLGKVPKPPKTVRYPINSSIAMKFGLPPWLSRLGLRETLDDGTLAYPFRVY